MLPVPGFRCNMNSDSWSNTLIVSSCRITSFVNLTSNSDGTAVLCGALDLLSFFLDCSGRGRLLLPAGSPSIPRAFICSLFSKGPQILFAASIPSVSSNPVSIGQKDGEVQERKARLVVLLSTTKITRHRTVQNQSVITHQCQHLEMIVHAMQMLCELLWQEETL